MLDMYGMYDCIVFYQVTGGVAEKDGRLQQDDQILSVNEFDMRQVSQEEAVNVLKVCVIPRSTAGQRGHIIIPII